MPSIETTPKYRFHKASKQAVVTLSGKDVYLGKYDSPESHAKYHREVAAWISMGRVLITKANPKVSELTQAYSSHARQHYVKRGKKTSRLDMVVYLAGILEARFGDDSIESFGPDKLLSIRHVWVTDGLARSTINSYVAQIREIFRWGTESGIVPVNTFLGLKAIRGLQKGRTKAKETDRVLPAPMASVKALLGDPKVRDDVKDRMRVQLLTGMRPGEVCTMRPCDVDRSGSVWIYKPEGHKSEHKDVSRIVVIGPKAQSILKPYMEIASAFSPESDVFPSRIFRTQHIDIEAKTPSRNCYREMIYRACKRLEVEHFHPNQLRHSAATEIRKQAGIEQARIALGHASVDMTEIYAEKDIEAIKELMGRIG